MTNPTISVRTGGFPAADVPLRDVGIVVPMDTIHQPFTDPRIVAALRKSRDLRVLATDLSQFTESTLMVKDATFEFNDAGVQEFLGQTLAFAGRSGNTSNTTTSSTSDVAMNSMSVTCSRTGKYLILYAATVGNGGANNDTFTSIYVNGVKQKGERKSDTLVNGYRLVHFGVAIAQATFGQTMEVRWRVSAGTATAENRHISAIWLGDN